MAVDETPPPEEKASSGNEKSKKNMILFGGIFILLFILASAANFIHLKMTYIPPEPVEEELIEEPVVHEEEGPVLTIDLGEEEEVHVPEEVIAEAVEDTLEKVRQDSIAREDSTRAVIEGLEARIREGDQLLAEAIRELTRVKKLIKAQVAEEDSLNLKRSVKLAKIVESMPPEEAAKMLESLDDLMVLDVLMRLKQRQAAKIMAEFSAQRAARLSEVILKPLIHG
jgi:flagellar motility protein MotE (MotC chaperone)